MKHLKKIFGNTKIYRFLSWIRNKYVEDLSKVYSPAQFREYGQNVTIESDVLINMTKRVIIKDHAFIHSGTLINSMGGLYIGKNTGIGYNCTIFTAQHRYRNAKTIPFDTIVELKPVIIRDYVWLGAGVMIMPGIEIGEGSIIGMGSVITKNVPPLAIITGNPAEVIGYRSKEHFEKCKEEGKFQNISVENYEEIIPYMFKIRFENELKQLGLI